MGSGFDARFPYLSEDSTFGLSSHWDYVGRHGADDFLPVISHKLSGGQFMAVQLSAVLANVLPCFNIAEFSATIPITQNKQTAHPVFHPTDCKRWKMPGRAVFIVQSYLVISPYISGRRSRKTPQLSRISRTASKSNVCSKIVSSSRPASSTSAPVSSAINDEP